MQEESVPVIRFKPDEARTLKISELFDGYEVLTFKGIVCNRIGDFVKMGDRIVATSIVTEGMTDVVTLSVFDSAGEFQHTLGRFGRGPDEYLYLPHEIVLTPDSNVLAGDVLGFHCYALDGTLLWQKRSEHPSYEYGVGYFTWMLNDSCAVYLNTPICGSTYRSEECLVNLVRAFNKMKYATGEYIQALEEKRKTLDLLHEEELEKLETEKRLEMTKLELLKSQINPHFLFNTLNVIGGMASLEEAETTEKMIRALSALFRYNLKNQDTEVCLSQELKIMEDYMYLQQMRFGDRITYRKDCSVDADKVIVPAFTFQPLVENAIIHGLSKKEEGGTVRVHIWQKDGFTLITIGDNGLGMDEAALMHLRGELEKEDGKTGIGLGNIFRRIRAMYQDGNVEIYSKKDVGTVVKIQIRHKEVGEHDVPCVGGGR